MPTINPRMQAAIAVVLLIYFGLALFLPAIPALSGFKIDPDFKQVLFALVTAVVFFFIGKNSDSANRDRQMQELALAVPAPDPNKPTGKPGDPLAVHEEPVSPRP